MSFISEAYREGQKAAKYELNPYPKNSKEYNDFERGVTQTIRSSKVENFGGFGSYWGDDDNDVTGSVPYKKSANSYLLARKK